MSFEKFKLEKNLSSASNLWYFKRRLLMAVDNDTVRRIAFLARLKVEPEKLEDTKSEFNKILDWIEQLNEVNTDNVEPLESVNDEHLKLRDDVVTEGNQRDEILANAPLSEYGYFVVPKVVK